MRVAACLALAVSLSACELTEVVLATSDDVVVTEIYLRTGGGPQRALLHRTQRGADSVLLDVPGARIEVRDAQNRIMTFEPVELAMCIDTAQNDRRQNLDGSCYQSTAATTFAISPGIQYRLRIELRDGGVLTGATTVPADFHLVRPSTTGCALPPQTLLPIQWTRSSTAWAYPAETHITGLKPFLATHGIEVERDPMRLFGLAISASDTALTFPAEFGLFQRFDDELVEALVLIQAGLPPGTTAEVIVGAADRNYVNWERGGNFNPSGMIRVPSVRGSGTGVFGSIVLHGFNVEVGSSTLPPC